VLGQDEKQISREELELCGINFCPDLGSGSSGSSGNDSTSAAAAVDKFSASTTSIYTLAGIYLGCSVLSAVVIALLVDPLSR
jgi:hypothetical protein